MNKLTKLTKLLAHLRALTLKSPKRPPGSRRAERVSARRKWQASPEYAQGAIAELRRQAAAAKTPRARQRALARLAKWGAVEA